MAALTDTERKLIVYFLKMASEEFSNHGCNDLDLKAIIPDLEERRKLMKELHEWNGDPEEYNPNRCNMAYDWFLMNFMAHKVKQMG